MNPTGAIVSVAADASNIARYNLINNSMDINDKIRIAKQTAIIAGAFCLVISLLLLLHYSRMQVSDPLESVVMERLVQRLSQEPGNDQLIQEIREFDLLARKAYFSGTRQVKTGSYLLLFFSAILVVSLRIYRSLLSRIEKPSEEEEDEILARSLSLKWILGGTAVMIFLALAAAFTMGDPITEYLAGVQPVTEEESTIRRVTITDALPGKAADENASDEASPPLATAEEGQPGASPAASTSFAASSAQSATPATSTTSAAPTSSGPGGQPAAVSPARTFPDENTIRQNHGSFRGPWGQGIVYQTNIPVEWDGKAGRNILWKVPVPLHAFSSPVIWGDRLFITGADQKERKVFCFNRHDGRLLWEASADNIPGSPVTVPRTTDDTGLGAPTVVADGTGIYAIFGTGDIIALDMEGRRMWARNLGVPDNHYGHSSSLLTLNEKLFVQYDTRNGGRVICLNVTNGETMWDISRASGISWSSPMLAKIGNNYQLIVKGNPIVAGYDPSNGRELWSVTAMGGEVGPSPAYGGGLVYAANEYSKMVAVDPSNGEIIWEDNYYLPEVSSPVYSDGLLFIATTYALVACFDAKTGEFLWEYDTDGIFYSSPVVANGYIYVTDTHGNTYIFRAGRKPDLVAKNPLGEEVHTIPAFADGRLYFRGEKHLYCIGN
jgi:outer membrane protein assembly factor BamB